MSDNNSNDSSKASSVSDSEKSSSKNSNKSVKSVTKKEDAGVSNAFKEKIINYIKIDDVIRKRQDEIKDLKEKKEECEEYILKYLDKSDAGFVKIPGGKLIKNQSESKGTLKIETIKESIIECIKKEKLTNSDEINKKLIDDIIEIMETKRGKVNRINLKRTFERIPKLKKIKTKK